MARLIPPPPARASLLLAVRIEAHFLLLPVLQALDLVVRLAELDTLHCREAGAGAEILLRRRTGALPIPRASTSGFPRGKIELPTAF